MTVAYGSGNLKNETGRMMRRFYDIELDTKVLLIR
jgi:hypothetical protein